MDTSAELLAAFKDIENEKGISKEVLFEAIEASLLNACKKNFGSSQNIKVVMDRETGKVQVFAQKTIVETANDTFLEISLEDARKINPHYTMGDIAEVIITPRNFGRIAAQSAKNLVIQKIREAERSLLFKEYKEKEREVVTGIIQRIDKKNVIVSLGKVEAVMTQSEQMPGETYNFNERIKVYILDVKDNSKGPLVSISRTHPELVKRLFESEVPEIFDGTVEIKSVSREAGSRTKLAVYSKNPNVEAVGSCVGQNGARVNVIVKELKGEKIDIINWSDNPREFISAALSPSKTLVVIIDEVNRSAKIVVPDYQLSLAIGKEGQNARLAAKLTGYRIDIKSESQAKATNFITEEELLAVEKPDLREVPKYLDEYDEGYYYDEGQDLKESAEYLDEYEDDDEGYYYNDDNYEDEYYDDEDDEYYEDEDSIEK